MPARSFRNWRRACSWACTLIVCAVAIAFTPAVARDGGTWTMPYTGSAATNGGAAFSVTNTGTGHGIFGQTSNTGYYGVVGYHGAPSGFGVAVLGESAS